MRSSSSSSTTPADPGQAESFADLLARVQACTVCAAQLQHPPRPILRVSPTARLLIVGQAPGRRVHETGIPWNDPSGDLLRQWLGMSREQFYNASRIAIVPTGLCYPGTVNGSDLPPRPECAPLWHLPLRAAMPDIRLTLLIGAYAQAYYLGKRRGHTLADTVAAWRDFVPEFVPLPHPSPRNRLWFKQHPWFEVEVIPMMRERLEPRWRQAIMAALDNQIRQDRTSGNPYETRHLAHQPLRPQGPCGAA